MMLSCSDFANLHHLLSGELRKTAFNDIDGGYSQSIRDLAEGTCCGVSSQRFHVVLGIGEILSAVLDHLYIKYYTYFCVQFGG